MRALEVARKAYDLNIVFDGGNIGKWGKCGIAAERLGQWNRLKGGFGAIGHGLISAMVRKLTDPDRVTVLLTGDGAFGYNILELETCIREQLPIIVIVAVDGAWGSVKTGLATRYTKSPLMTFSELPKTRFDQLAQAVGATGVWVDTLEQLESAIDRVVKHATTAVIAVNTLTVGSPAVYATEGY